VAHVDLSRGWELREEPLDCEVQRGTLGAQVHRANVINSVGENHEED
jgi:hypothetical protein